MTHVTTHYKVQVYAYWKPSWILVGSGPAGNTIEQARARAKQELTRHHNVSPDNIKIHIEKTVTTTEVVEEIDSDNFEFWILSNC